MIGRKIIQLDKVDSTNNYVANLLKDGAIDHGTVILADEQTSGRGQRGSEWTSKAGENVILSLYLDTAILSVNDQFILTQFISISVSNTCKKYNVNTEIKWPNDIYINNKKIAGILIENQIKGSNLNGSIIGIGLNANQMSFGQLNATSIKKETGQFVSTKEFVFSLINEMNIYWDMIYSNEFSILNKLYLKNLWLLNKKAKYKDSEGEFEGIIKGTDEIGLLLLEKKGKIKKYNLKEISYAF